MNDPKRLEQDDASRIARLERSVFWLKLGFVVLFCAVVGLLVPPIAAAVGTVFFIIALAIGVIVVIWTIIYILDRVSPNTQSKS